MAYTAGYAPRASQAQVMRVLNPGLEHLSRTMPRAMEGLAPTTVRGVVGKAALPLFVADTVGQSSKYLSDKSRETGQDTATALASQVRPTTSWSAPTSTMAISATNPFTGAPVKKTVAEVAPPAKSGWGTWADWERNQNDFIMNEMVPAVPKPKDTTDDDKNKQPPPALPSTPVSPEYNPMYQEGVANDYGTARANVGAALQPSIDRYNNLFNEMNNFSGGTSFGGAIANQMALGQLNTAAAKGADLAAHKATNETALGNQLISQGLESRKAGNALPDYFQKQRMEGEANRFYNPEKYDLEKAQAEHQRASTKSQENAHIKDKLWVDEYKKLNPELQSQALFPSLAKDNKIDYGGIGKLIESGDPALTTLGKLILEQQLKSQNEKSTQRKGTK